MFKKVTEYFRKNRALSTLLILIGVSSIIIWKFGDFSIFALKFSTIIWSMVTGCIGWVASKNVGPFLLNRTREYYKANLFEKEFKDFETLMIENNELGILLFTTANIVYLLSLDLSPVFSVDVQLPVAVILLMILRGTASGLFAVLLLRFSVRFLSLIEILFTPKVRETPPIQDDQILKYVVNMGTYTIAPFICYYWVVFSFNIDFDWEKGFLLSAIIIAIGFAFRSVANDVLSSIIIIVERTFQIKDYIEIDGIIGKITGIGIRKTDVKGLDGSMFTIPNGDFTSKIIINHSDKTTNGISIPFSINASCRYANRKKFEKKLLNFVNEKCEPARDHEISNYPRVSLITEGIKDGFFQYKLEFAIRIEDTHTGKNNSTSGKIKYWLNREKKQKVCSMLVDQIQRIAGEFQISLKHN